MNTEKVFALPEFVDDKKWQVIDTKELPSVDFKSSIIHAPIASDDVSHCIRLQQIGKIKWDDDTNVDSVANSCLFKAIDDYRINYLLKKSGVDISAGFINEKTITKILNNDPKIMAVSGALITANTANPVKLEDRELNTIVNLITEAIESNPTKKKAFDTFQEVKKFFTRDAVYQKIEGLASKGFNKDKNNKDIISGTPEEIYGEVLEDLEEDDKLNNIPKEVRDQLPHDSLKEMTGQIINNNKQVDFVPWGEMNIHEPSRSIQASGKFNKRWIGAEEGVYPRYPHRYFIDQRIFARKIRLPGGTVIVDSSGSMDLSPDDIKQIVLHAPGCTVANYSGNRRHGILRILAKNGLRCQDGLCCRPSGGCNVIDYPALRWAYKQNHPRIWVSDLSVTGIGDLHGIGNLLQCAAVVKKGRFFVAKNMVEAIKILKRLGKFYKKS